MEQRRKGATKKKEKQFSSRKIIIHRIGFDTFCVCIGWVCVCVHCARAKQRPASTHWLSVLSVRLCVWVEEKIENARTQRRTVIVIDNVILHTICSTTCVSVCRCVWMFIFAVLHHFHFSEWMSVIGFLHHTEQPKQCEHVVLHSFALCSPFNVYGAIDCSYRLHWMLNEFVCVCLFHVAIEHTHTDAAERYFCLWKFIFIKIENSIETAQTLYLESHAIFCVILFSTSTEVPICHSKP